MKRVAGLRRRSYHQWQKVRQLFDPFKGQKGQDKWVALKALPLMRDGFFLDLAASNGIANNNTYFFEKWLGWRGICIEPNPAFYSKLVKNRRCIVDSSVISDRNEEVAFRTDNGGCGGIIAEDTDNNFRLRGNQLEHAEIVSLPAKTLTQLLDHHQAPPVIDYFSLDVEGSEERVIRGTDFSRYRFRCLTIERPSPQTNEILQANDYVFIKNHRYDAFYVHASLLSERALPRHPFKQISAKKR